MNRLLAALSCLCIATSLIAQESPPELSRFGAGDGPRLDEGGVLRLLDEQRSELQSNAIGFARQREGAVEHWSLAGELRVLEGGDGGSLMFLSTAEYGARGPAPFLRSQVEPNLGGSFAVGIDVHNPPNDEMFGPWGNYQDRPQREISLHWDGRELIKRVAPAEFRGDFAELAIEVAQVIGGAEVSVTIAGAAVYERHFIAGMLPYEWRLAVGAGTRADASTEFDLRNIEISHGEPAAKRRPPKHVEVFNHVLTDNSKTFFEADVELPPADWAFGRVILTLEIHDAGPAWDEWDRNGEISVIDAAGNRRGIVPFITSYRTPCHWQVDVSHFRPWLADKTRLRIDAGTNFYKNRGYMMSVSLDYYHGTPSLEPYDITTLWHGTAKHGDDRFATFFEPLTIAIHGDSKAARIWTTTTGHSQVGEFTPSSRSIVFAPNACSPEGEQRFDNLLWKTDCYLNPNRPQYGTWKFARAGWAPGDVVHPWWIDLTPHLLIPEVAGVRYEPQPYDFSAAEQQPTPAQIAEASQVVRCYLIQYRAPTALITAPNLRITQVQGDGNADQAGIQAGDHLFSYYDRRIESVGDLRAAMRAATKADQARVPVVVFRGNQRLELEITTGRLGIGLGSN